jgi:phosphoenolpyruvate-protein kinase (PTS system EI component)
MIMVQKQLVFTVQNSLYMDSQDFPTEDEQYEAIQAVLEGMNGKPVVVRTMDIGGDKEFLTSIFRKK